MFSEWWDRGGFTAVSISLWNPWHVLIMSAWHPCCLYHVRVSFALSVSNPCQVHTIFVPNPCPKLYVRHGHQLSVLHQYGLRVVCAMSVSYPHVIWHKDVMRMWYEHVKDGMDAVRTCCRGDADLIRKFVRINYFNSLKKIDTHKLGPRDRGWFNTDMIRSTRTWYGHLSMSHPCANPFMCKRSTFV